jgi:LPXTG-motif cell wall-anchored protein
VPGGGGTLPTTGNDYSAVAFGAGCLLLVGLALRGLTKRGKEA